MIWYAVGGVIVILIVYIIVTYNNFVKANIKVEEAFSTMDVYLKKRWDLIPNLVEIVKGYAKHEKDTLKEITELRSKTYDKMNTSQKIDLNNKMSEGINKLMVISESYPELKSNENFITLSNQLMKIEEDIANSRKYYNGSVKLLNIKVKVFPSNVVAKLFGFKEQKMFEASIEERNDVKIKIGRASCRERV